MDGWARKLFLGSLLLVARIQIIQTSSTMRMRSTTAPAMPLAMYVKSLLICAEERKWLNVVKLA